MEKTELQTSRNVSSIFRNFIEMEKSLQSPTNIEIELFLAAVGSVITIIVIFSYLIGCLMKKNTNQNQRVRKKITEVYTTDKMQNNSKRITTMLNHNKVLKDLHAATDKCNDILQSMKCIELAIYCPHLINMPVTSDGVTPFHRVCYRGNEALVEFMLAKGADPWKKTVAGENAICLAIQYYIHNTEVKDFPCLEMLYSAGCYLPYDDEWYQICIHLAIINRNKRLVNWLISHSSRKQYQEFGLRTTSFS